MATITNPGSSQTVVIDQNDVVVLQLNYSDMGSSGPPATPSNAVTIASYGARNTIVLAAGDSSVSSTPPSGGYDTTGFVMSSSFNIGDEVDFMVLGPFHPYAVWDSSGNLIDGGGSQMNGVLKKVAADTVSSTGQSKSWVFA